MIIISADHGHIPVDGAVYLNDYPDLLDCLALPLSLEERCNAVFVKDGMQRRFKELFNHYLSTDFCLMSVTQALETNLFGTGVPHNRARDFLGDFIILSRGGDFFKAMCEWVGSLRGVKRGSCWYHTC